MARSSTRRLLAALVALPVAVATAAAVPAPALGAEVVAAQVAGGLSAPAAVVTLGSGDSRTLWVSDQTRGLCRLDPVAGGQRAIVASTCSTAADTPGAAVYDADTQAVYLADTATTGQGVTRLTYDATAHTVGAAVTIAPRATGKTPGSLALGPDGGLYVGYTDSPSLDRVTTPSGATHLTQAVGRAIAGHVNAIAFVGSTLYLAEPTAVTSITNAPACAACTATKVTASTAAAPTALTSDNLGALVYADTPAASPSRSRVLRLDTAANTESALASTGTPAAGGAAVPFTHISALGLDDAGTLYAADDLTSASADRLWSAAAGTPLQPPFAPPAPSAPDLAASSDKGRSATDNITNTTGPVVTGTAAPGARVNIQLGARVVGSGVAGLTGAFSVTTAGVTPGRRTLTAQALRGVRSSVLSSPLALTVDTTRPPLRMAERPRTTTFVHTPRFRWASEKNTRSACSLQPVTAAPVFVGCHTPFTSAALADGQYRFLVRVADVAGNLRTSSPANFQLRSARSLPGKPRVVERSPGIGATGIERFNDVEVRFSELVRNLSRRNVHLTDTRGRRVRVRLHVDTRGAVATLDPVQTLPADRTFVVTVRPGVTDFSGKHLAKRQQWRFTTGPRPLVEAARPFVNSTGVPRIANVTVIFNESVRDVNTTSMRLVDAVTHKRVAARVRVVDSTLALIDPVAKLARHRGYVVFVTSRIRDRAGNHLIARVWAFTTG